FGARVGEHPLHLLFEHGWRVECLLFRDLQQLVIRDAAPQEERQTRRELEVGNAIRRLRRRALGLALEPKQKLRADEDAPQGELEARVESILRAVAVSR